MLVSQQQCPHSVTTTSINDRSAVSRHKQYCNGWEQEKSPLALFCRQIAQRTCGEEEEKKNFGEWYTVRASGLRRAEEKHFQSWSCLCWISQSDPRLFKWLSEIHCYLQTYLSHLLNLTWMACIVTGICHSMPSRMTHSILLWSVVLAEWHPSCLPRPYKISVHKINLFHGLTTVKVWLISAAKTTWLCGETSCFSFNFFKGDFFCHGSFLL